MSNWRSQILSEFTPKVARLTLVSDPDGLLLENGFRVFLTSDHGNIEAAGCGRPAEGATADVSGERARIDPHSLLRRPVKERFPDALEWPPIGLPEVFWPLLPTDRSAFVRKKECLVGHGGGSLEELIVPLASPGYPAARSG